MCDFTKTTDLVRAIPPSNNLPKLVPICQNGYGTICMLVQPNPTSFAQNTNRTIPNNNQYSTIFPESFAEPQFINMSQRYKSSDLEKSIASQKTTEVLNREELSQKQAKKENTIKIYKNPFDYTYMNRNIERSFAKRRLELAEKELNKDQTITWNCLICAVKYETKSALIDHYEMHKNVTDQLEDNNVSNNKVESISCPICNQTFKQEGTYHRHVFSNHRTKEYSCNVCKSHFNNEYYLSLHMSLHSKDRKTFVCNVCKQFSTTETPSLAAHINAEHVKDVFFCKECGKTFTSKAWFNDHKIFHIKSKKFFCDKCEISYPCHKAFTEHLITHDINEDSNVKYKCSDCDLTFPLEKNLISHNRYKHSQPNTFLCNVCGKGFPFQSPLTQHMKIHGEGQYVCSTCGRKFKKSQLLATHMRTHTGEKPNKCNICGKCFSQKVTLNVHLRTHSGERPYPCGKCKRGFITKTIRDIHQKSCKK